MNTSELRNKTVEQLNVELLSVLQEQFNLRVQRGVGQTPQSHLFKNAKKQIARIKTILRQKEGL